MFASFAHKLIFVLGVLFCVVLATTFSATGLFGEIPQEKVYAIWQYVEDYYKGNQTTLDWGGAILGAIVTAASGTLAIYKSWYYAEFKLPDRLRNFVERQRSSLLASRPSLVEIVDEASIGGGKLSPVFHRDRFNFLIAGNKIWRRWNLASNLADNVQDSKRRIEILNARTELLRTEVATGHLIRGAYYSRLADLTTNDEYRRQDLSSKAAKEYEEALIIAPDDVDLLEIAARQAIQLGHETLARSHLEQILRCPGMHTLSKARANRLIAQILLRSPEEDVLKEARNRVNTAIKDLKPSFYVALKKELELGWCYLTLGRIQTKREAFFAAERALEKAKNSFEKQPASNRTPGLSEVRVAEKQLVLDRNANQESQA